MSIRFPQAFLRWPEMPVPLRHADASAAHDRRCRSVTAARFEMRKPGGSILAAGDQSRAHLGTGVWSDPSPSRGTPREVARGTQDRTGGASVAKTTWCSIR